MESNEKTLKLTRISDEELKNFLDMKFKDFSAEEVNFDLFKDEVNTLTFQIEFKGDSAGIAQFYDIDWINRSACIRIFWDEAIENDVEVKVVRLMLKYAFEVLNLNRVYSKVVEYKKDTISVLKKCGFLQEGMERQAKFFKGKYWDVLRFSMLYEDYWRAIEDLK
ncbi:MAG: hypothetical protein PWQ45_702 [Thermosipho sp. (in: thermotogales)]|nr:hypothetical protein [Thermosipho sp. (in: thermotogales)]